MADGLQALTERERETLRLLLAGHDIKSIAARQALSVHTVNERLREARRKLGASSSRQAARLLAEAEPHPEFSGDKETGVAAPAGGADNTGQPGRLQGRGRSLIWLGGGMLAMSLLIAAAVAATMLQPTAVPPAPAAPVAIAPVKAPDAQALAAASRWLGLLDDKHWDESWNGVGGLVTAQMSKTTWTGSIQAARQPLGAVSSRKFRDAGKASELPGAPKGDYQIIQFTTNFEHKPGVIERVTLAHEPAGWKVIGYYLV